MWYNGEKRRNGEVDMIIYFSKINLESTELLEMYKKKEMFDTMRKCILSFLENGTEYETEGSFKSDDGEVHFTKTKYRLSIGLKDDSYVSGVIYKSATLYYKRINAATEEVESHSIPTIEDIRFYFDVNREIIGFHTRSRFGYQEFNRAFSGIINMCMEKNNSPLRFSISLYNEGMEINEIERELRNIKNIKRLEFNFRLPNPADGNMLEQLNAGLTNTAELMEEANANAMSVIFDSNGTIGLNIDSGEIRENIERVGHLSKGITDKDATKNGYVRVIATGKDGKKYTTEEQKPIKRETIGETAEEFFLACRDTILNIFSK